MAVSQSQVPLTHMFAELSSLEDLKIPVQRSSRLQYTCLSVSQRYIALGSNTGGVYIFSRESLKHLQVVFGDVEVSMVTVTALSPNDQNVALAVSSGQVIVMELNIERRVRPERLRQTSDHVGATVTAMVWDSSSSGLFVADSKGKVTLVNVPNSKAKTLFTLPSEIIVRLDSSIYQLDWWGSKLLVSTVSRTYLLNTTRHQFSQIGQKARDGEFGACFFLEPSSNYPVIYCARPGSRMWEVDFEGNVLNTHQFKQNLGTPPLPIISQYLNLEEALLSTWSGPQSVNFRKMFRLGEFILTWSNRGIYVFDPINVKVVLWTDTFQGGVTDMCVVKNEVYVFFKSQEVRRLVFLPIFLMCSALTSRSRCALAAQLLLYMESFALRPTLLKRLKKELVPQLMTHLLAEGYSDLAEKVSGMLDDVSVNSVDSDITQEESARYPQYSTQLSGILVVNDGSITSSDKGTGWRSATPVNFTLEKKTEFEPPDGDRQQTLHWKTTSEILSDSDGIPEPIQIHTYKEYLSDYVSVEDTINGEMNNNVEQVLVKDVEGDKKNADQQMSVCDDVDDTLTDNFKPETDEARCGSFEKIDLKVKVDDDLPFDESPVTQENVFGLEEKTPSCHSQEDTSHSSRIGSSPEPNKCSQNQQYECEEDRNQGADTQERDVLEVTEIHPSPEKMPERTEMLERADSSPALQVDEADTSTVETGSGSPQSHVETGSGSPQSHVETGTGSPQTHVETGSGSPQTHVETGSGSPQNHVETGLGSPQTHVETGSGSPQTHVETGTGSTQTHVETGLGSPQTHVETGSGSPQTHVETGSGSPQTHVETGSGSPQTHVETGSGSPQSHVETGTGSTQTHVETGSGSPQNHVDFDAESRVTPGAGGETNSGQNALTGQIKKKKKVRANEVDISGGTIKRSFSTGTLKQTKKKEKRLHRGRSLESVEDMEEVAGLYVQTNTSIVSSIDSIDEEEGRIGVEDISTLQAFGEDIPTIVKSSVTSMTVLPNSDRFAEMMQSSSEGCLLAHGGDMQETSTPQEATSLDSSSEVQAFTEGEVTVKTHSDFASLSESQQSRAEMEVIPPLLQRLSAVGVAPPVAGAGENEALGSQETSVRGLLAGATRHGRNLLSVRDRVSTKITSTTKSFIKRVREKNLLPSRSPSGSSPTGNLPSPGSPHVDRMQAGSSAAALQEAAVADEGDGLDLESQIDLTSFWAKTTQTQKELEKPYVLLNAELLKDVLNSWAHELNKILLAYHVESYKNHQGKTGEQEEDSKVTAESMKELSRNEEASMREMQEEDEQEKSEEFDTTRQAEKGGSDQDGENTVSKSRQAEKGGSDQDGENTVSKSRQADAEFVLTSEDERKVLNLSKTGEAVDLNQSRSVPDNGKTGTDMLSDSPDLACVVTTPANQSPASMEAKSDHEECEKDKWCTGTGPEADDIVLMKDVSEVCHTQDPFGFSQQEHMVVSALALHCLRAGCFGDVLSIFSAWKTGPEEIHSTPQQVSLSSSFTSTNFEPHSRLQDGKVVRRDALPCVDKLSNRTEAPEKSSSNSSCGRVLHAADLSVSRELEQSSSGAVSVEDAIGEGACQVAFLKSDCTSQSGWNQAFLAIAQVESASPAEVLKDDASQEREKDVERALFVQLHYHLLPHWRVRRLVTETAGNVYRTWCSLITCYKSLGMGDIVWMKLREMDVPGALDYLRSGILPHRVAFLGHVASAFALSPLQVMEFAVEMPRQVTFRDVLYLCQLLNKPRLKVATHYLTLRLISVFDHKNKRLEVVQEMCRTLEGKLAVLECLLSLRADHQSVAVTKTVFSGGADNSKLPPDMVEDVLCSVLSLVKDSELLLVLNVCWDHRYWAGCLSLLARSNQWQRALQLIVQLDDVSLLDGSREYGFMPRNVAEWKYLFQLYSQQSYVQAQTSPTFSSHEFVGTKLKTLQIQTVLGRPDGAENAAGEADVENTARNAAKEKMWFPVDGETVQQRKPDANPQTADGSSPMSDSGSSRLQPQHSASNFKDSCVREGDYLQASSSVESGTSQQRLSWATLGLLAASQVGALCAVGLLEECFSDASQGGLEGNIDEEFYSQCIAMSFIQQRQKLVIHNMLEKVDSYLWAKKPVHLPPQVHYAVMQEKAALERDRTEGNYQNLFAKLSSTPLPELPLAEDPECHWGVPIDLNSLCQICQLHVTEAVSHMEPGVLVFRCGHVFHKFCVPDQVCPLC